MPCVAGLQPRASTEGPHNSAIRLLSRVARAAILSRTMHGPPSTWAADLLAAFRMGRLSAEELWCVVLDCHGLSDPAPVVDLVLRSHAALLAPALGLPPGPPALVQAPADPQSEAELFVLDEAADDLSIPA